MARDRSRQGGPSGLVVVDKPAGMTSHDVVGRMRRIAGTRRVGHAGTLDPMATGVLILGINKATKLLTWVSGESKTYSATIRLGQSTLTDDAEGEVTNHASDSDLSEIADSAVHAAVGELRGEIMQVPSAVSAIKVNGVRSYAKVRSGQEVELQARPVTVHAFEVLGIRRTHVSEDNTMQPVIDVDVEVTCSSGTYVRALARDIGKQLGVGGHLIRLRRLSVGEVGIDDAATLEDLATAGERGEALPILALERAAERLFARRDLDDEEATAVSNGRWIPPNSDHADAPGNRSEDSGAGRADDIVPAAELTAGFAPDGTLVALVQNQRRKGKQVGVPHLVFASGCRFPIDRENGGEA